MRKPEKQQKPLLPRDASISERQRDVLDALSIYDYPVRPMDIGARDGSHHSATLSGLVRRGFVERTKLHAIYCPNGSTSRKKLVDNRWIITEGHPPSTACGCKGSCQYKITPAGRKAIDPRAYPVNTKENANDQAD